MTNPEEVLVLEYNGIRYECIAKSGKGSFGIVYKALRKDTNTVVAIKRVLIDPKYKNRELQIMQNLTHPNIVELTDHFTENYKDQLYLNLVLSYMPKTLSEINSSYVKLKERIPIFHVKLYAYQLCRGLAYVHYLGICHRDIKPQNLLIDPQTQHLRLCDFGSAKKLVSGESNIAYICSRYYRAPELIFNANDYTTAIDIWSTGCVIAEAILGTPLFAGESGMDQLVEIIKVLGTPTKEEIYQMNSRHEFKPFPSIKPHPWQKLFPSQTPSVLLDLMAKMLVYTPSLRIKALETCAQSCFEELRKLHDTPLIANLQLFNFTPKEEENAISQNLLSRLLPKKEDNPQPEEQSLNLGQSPNRH